MHTNTAFGFTYSWFDCYPSDRNGEAGREKNNRCGVWRLGVIVFVLLGCAFSRF